MFMGFLDRLLGRRESTSSVGERLGKDDIVQIVRDYSAVLSSGSPGPGRVADVRRLPHPKAHIKKALLVAMQVSNDQAMVAALTNAYLSLAEYQEGVGDEILGLDLTKVDMSASLEQQARVIADQSKGMEKWNALVEAESRLLLSDLERLALR
jgi:hypothetical protein